MQQYYVLETVEGLTEGAAECYHRLPQEEHDQANMLEGPFWLDSGNWPFKIRVRAKVNQGPIATFIQTFKNLVVVDIGY